MGVYIQNGKVLSSGSGSGIKEPPIIDISSDYGVTKDGSNLVSSVRNRYNANKFRSPVGEEPFEDGDGFDFSAGSKLITISSLINSSEPWTVEFWIKFKVDTLTTRQRMFTFETGAWVQNYIGILTAYNKDTVDLQWYEFGSILSKTVVNGSSIGALGQPDVWTHIYTQYDGGEYSSFIGGKLALSFKNINPTILTKSDITLGRPLAVNTNPLIGNMESIKVSQTAKQKWKPIIPISGINRFLNHEQVFTPPTFPNTIL